MTTQFIAIKEAEGIYSDVMKPYKKWFEKVYVSSLIEIDKNLYRNVCTLNRFNKSYLRKVVLCTDKGDVVKTKAHLQKYFEVLTYLHYFKVFSKNIAFDARQYGEDKFGAVKTSLKKIHNDLHPVLTESDKAILEEHLNYYRNTMNALDELAELSKECLNLIDKLKKLNDASILTEEFINILHDKMIQREKTRNMIEAYVLENGLTVRNSIRDILNNEKYYKHISDNNDKVRILREADNADNIQFTIIQSGKKDWKLSEKWFEIDKGKFTVNKYISDLMNISESKVFLKINSMLIENEHWVYSPKLKY